MMNGIDRNASTGLTNRLTSVNTSPAPSSAHQSLP
jgi:hypothetical protein